MLFHTWPFLVFFALAFVGHLCLRRTKLWPAWLLVCSYVFYGWWSPLFLLLILYSTALDYFCVLLMDRGQRKKLWLMVSISNNLLLLAFFKYAGFVTENLNAILSGLGAGYALPAPNITLPVGISFFTFQSMSYTIDYYRGNIARETSFVRFAAFVSLFPQLVAGPIERAKALLPQMQQTPPLRMTDIADGLSLFVVGLFKKVALANYLALYVDRVYAVPENFAAPALILATVAFAWQIYFDFSGYTDMARGVARAMGIRLMANFNHPYLATSLPDFWARWHISLSTWFRDYVYIPLGGNRKGPWRMYFNLLLTFVISGFWHGAAWRFVIWGALHGGATIVWRYLEANRLYRRLPTVFRQLSVFSFVCFAWVFFRATSLADAWSIVTRIADFAWQDPRFPLVALGMTLTVWLYQAIIESRLSAFAWKPALQFTLVLGMLVYLCLAPGSGDQPFIYFQF